ncbi:MAG: VCBS repeat-containing protein [Deltaproteobacteria bacterium]|nr:VCBS repeat-containing protein [Myxococcales bacterium]MDP3214534.1 VCBS repeat-containing protein [Deltaproteobacteria bacterium]
MYRLDMSLPTTLQLLIVGIVVLPGGVGCGSRTTATDAAPADAALSDAAPFDRTEVADAPPERDTAGPRDAIARKDAPTPDAPTPDAPAPDAPAPDAPDAAVGLPRQVAPLAGARVTQRRPTLRWTVPSGAPGVRIEVCADRACFVVEHGWTSAASEGRPPADLSPGVHFWRLSRGGRSSPVWPFLVPARSGEADTSWSALTDFNGDGRPDFVVTSRAGDAGGVTARAYLGRADGLPTPGPTFTAADNALVRAVGDLDGDGYGELAVSRACAEPGVDRIEIHRGGPEGPAPSPSWSIAWPPSTCVLGRPFVGVGDVNRDGYGDLLAETPVRASTAGGFGRRVELYLGGPADRPLTPSTVLEGGNEYNSFGGPTALGDVNGDGFADAALVMRAGFLMGGAILPASVLVYSGGAGGFERPPVRLPSPVASDTGYGVLPDAPFDHDGDGFADVAVGNGWQPDAEGRSPSHIDLHPGAREWAAAPPAVPLLLTPFMGNLRGGSSVSPGDFDGDGRDDLAVLVTQRGRVAVQLFRGGDAGARAYFVIDDRALSGRGAQGCDLDGDGRAELVVSLSSPGADAPIVGQGIMVLDGGPWPVGETPRAWLWGPASDAMTLVR